MEYKHDDMCWYERLLRYELEKKEMIEEHPEWTPKQRECAIKTLADKWDV